MPQPIDFEAVIFKPTRELSEDELATLGGMGLQLEMLEQQPEEEGNSLRLPSPEDEHYEKVYPRSTEAYVGKEVFWWLGEEVGLPLRASGRLFLELCYPVRSDMAIRGKRAHLDTVEPSELGLDVSTRVAENIPFPPYKIAASNYGGNISYYHDRYEREEAETSAVIFLKSILDFGRIRTDLNLLLSAQTRSALLTLWPRLEQLEESPTA